MSHLIFCFRQAVQATAIFFTSPALRFAETETMLASPASLLFRLLFTDMVKTEDGHECQKVR